MNECKNWIIIHIQCYQGSPRQIIISHPVCFVLYLNKQWALSNHGQLIRLVIRDTINTLTGAHTIPDLSRNRSIFHEFQHFSTHHINFHLDRRNRSELPRTYSSDKRPNATELSLTEGLPQHKLRPKLNVSPRRRAHWWIYKCGV